MSFETPTLKIGYTKIVQSGDLIEVYNYEKEPTPKRFVARRKRRRSGYKRRLARNIQRAKNNFRRLVRASLGLGNPYFVTLTMVDVVGVPRAYKAFSEFGVRLRARYKGRAIEWVAVPEFQERGAVHYHCLVWGISHEDHSRERSTRALQACWGRGFLDIRSSDGHPKIASYMAKYMSKTMQDDRLQGQKCYSASRGLMRSVLLNSATQIAVFTEEFGLNEVTGDSEVLTLLNERVYNTEWLGRCQYRAYSSKEHKNAQS